MAILKEFRGKRPRVDAAAFVAENAALIGDVTVGRDSSVWYGAVLRGDFSPITIGEGSSVQDNVTMHCEMDRPLRVGNNVTIGHNAVIHCSAVGDNTLVGMGAVLLDGAVIGEGCIIGAGAVVRENEIVPDHTLMVGVPAKAVRAVTPEQLRALEAPAEYIGIARAYLALEK